MGAKRKIDDKYSRPKERQPKGAGASTTNNDIYDYRWMMRRKKTLTHALMIGKEEKS